MEKKSLAEAHRGLRDTYNRIAEDWHKDHAEDSWWIGGTNAFVAMLPRGAHVLDAGCGGGTKAKYLASCGLTVTGIDMSEKLIDIARRENPKLHFRVMEMEHAEHRLGLFDAIFAQASLLHVRRKDLGRTVKALARCLKPGGCMYVAVKGPQLGQSLEEARVERDYGEPYTRFFSYYTPADIETAFANAGMETVHHKDRKVGHTEWVQMIGRKI